MITSSLDANGDNDYADVGDIVQTWTFDDTGLILLSYDLESPLGTLVNSVDWGYTDMDTMDWVPGDYTNGDDLGFAYYLF
jgi:hypothetical protein